jgi:hypothetical protein
MAEMSDGVDTGGTDEADRPRHARHEDDEATALRELTAAVQELTGQTEENHARSQARERVIDHLHAEVDRLRTGEEGLLLKPVTTDLQRLRNDLIRQAASLADRLDREQVADLLMSFALSAELALERCGSVPIRPRPGDPFAAREHRVVRLVEAERPEQDETVAEVLADGYLDTRTERVTAPARVTVWRWTAPQDIENDQRREMSADV